MVTRIYASHTKADFVGVRETDIHRFGEFYVAAIPREIKGNFEIVATATESAFTIEYNAAHISYDDIVDMFEQAIAPRNPH